MTAHGSRTCAGRARWGKSKASARHRSATSHANSRGQTRESDYCLWQEKKHDRETGRPCPHATTVLDQSDRSHKWGSFFPGADVERIRASKDFLRHQGASRDSQRTGLNTRRDSEAGSIHSVMPSGRPTHPILCVHRALFAPSLSACSATLTLLARCGRGPPSEFSGTSSQKRQIREGNKQLLKELLEDNRSLHAECKQMKQALATTKKRIQQLESE